MQPTRDEIEVAAYYRWERRGGIHGSDQEDWLATEKDLTFARNYRWIARHKLQAEDGESVPIGKPEGNRPRRCRYCEMAAPGASFEETPLLIPRGVGNSALVAWDECDDCRAHYAEHLEEAFEEFARPWLKPRPDLDRLEFQGIAPAAHKALVRIGIGLLPPSELHHFGDTIEWVSNPDHDREASLLDDMGVRIYWNADGVPTPFASLARRTDDSSGLPYLVFFLGLRNVVFQVRLPLSPCDEDLTASEVAGPELSMSMGSGPRYRASESRLLQVGRELPVGRNEVHLMTSTAG